MKKLKVIELFAGVGGFRIGLEKTNKYEVVWSNQWEPSTKLQHASMVYENAFGIVGHSNVNIEEVPTEDIPDADVLVGGFPCQDYSVANSLKRSGGLEGKKGVLWWSINRILSEKKNKPKYLILENVDRLLKSPVKQRGRDFAVMLRCLADLNYHVEWRVVDASEYGFPQRRKRVFIIAYLKTTQQAKDFERNPIDWLENSGVLASSLPISNIENHSSFEIDSNLLEVSTGFNLNEKPLSPFLNSGGMINGYVFTFKSKPQYDGKKLTLGDVILQDNISEDFKVSEEDLDKWRYAKGAKKEKRKTKEGFEYNFSEGAMSFPDDLNKPSRTIITSEGGTSVSRFKHVIYQDGVFRRLTPIELERLNGFPDNHTKLEGITDGKRAFFMGNALVIGIVEKIGNSLIN